MREIKAWKKGSPPPPRLLKFPDGKIDLIPGCGMRTWGSEVWDYISEIDDAELLAALIFDLSAQPDCIRAAVRQLIRLKSVGYLARLLEEKRRKEPSAFRRSELAVLAQILRSPYVAVKVARIASEDMGPDKAEKALREMKAELEAGKAWAEAYRKSADLNPDMRDRAKNPKSVRTLICYLYDGIVSPSGFDILDYRMAQRLPPEHLRELFRAKRGTHVFKREDGVYLYRIEGYFDGAAQHGGIPGAAIIEVEMDYLVAWQRLEAWHIRETSSALDMLYPEDADPQAYDLGPTSLMILLVDRASGKVRSISVCHDMDRPKKFREWLEPDRYDLSCSPPGPGVE